MKTLLGISPLVIALSLMTTLGLSTSSSPAAASQQKQVYSSKAIVNQLLNWHYSQKYFDDKLSSELLDNYIQRIDPRKQFFLQSDIQEFEPYRKQLDNQIKQGNLAVSEIIFNRYRDRYKTLLKKTLDDWPNSIRQFDFTKNEQILIDREDTSWPKNQAEADELWRKSLKNMVLSLELADKDKKEVEKILKKRLSFQLKNLEKTDDDDIFQLYMNSLTELYDPHTNYFSPQTSENFNINMSLRLQGIGAVLQSSEGDVNVVRLVPAGPADKQGELKPNDKIIAVGQGKKGEMVDVVGWRLDDVVNLIRGKPKTVVRLEVVRGKAANEKHQMIQIVRDNVKLEEQSAQKAIIEIKDKNNQPQKVGVIKIPTFYIDFEGYHRGDPNYKSTSRDVKRLIKELQKENVEGIVIDLRDNGGGSLLEANSLTGLFIEQGPTVQIRQSNNKVYPQGKRRPSAFYDGPLVVLIDRLSASASEIFAAAIQDYQRGLVVGNQSYGKGTVQTMKDLPYGSLKITESKFYRVSGDSTQHRGVIPDIEMPSLYDKDEIGESALDHALEWDQIKPTRHKTYLDYSQILPGVTSEHKKRINLDPDFIFLKKSQALEDEAEQDYVSLNKATRLQKKADMEAKFLAVENERRKSKGEKLLKSLDELDEEESDKPADDYYKIDTEKDYYLREASRILLDASEQLAQKCSTSTSIFCKNPITQNMISTQQRVQ